MYMYWNVGYSIAAKRVDFRQKNPPTSRVFHPKIILVCPFLPAGEGQTYKDKEQNYFTECVVF